MELFPAVAVSQVEAVAGAGPPPIVLPAEAEIKYAAAASRPSACWALRSIRARAVLVGALGQVRRVIVEAAVAGGGVAVSRQGELGLGAGRALWYSRRRLCPWSPLPWARLRDWLRSSDSAPSGVLAPRPSLTAWKRGESWKPAATVPSSLRP